MHTNYFMRKKDTDVTKRIQCSIGQLYRLVVCFHCYLFIIIRRCCSRTWWRCDDYFGQCPSNWAFETKLARTTKQYVTNNQHKREADTKLNSVHANDWFGCLKQCERTIAYAVSEIRSCLVEFATSLKLAAIVIMIMIIMIIIVIILISSPYGQTFHLCHTPNRSQKIWRPIWKTYVKIIVI